MTLFLNDADGPDSNGWSLGYKFLFEHAHRMEEVQFELSDDASTGTEGIPLHSLLFSSLAKVWIANDETRWTDSVSFDNLHAPMISYLLLSNSSIGLFFQRFIPWANLSSLRLEDCQIS